MIEIKAKTEAEAKEAAVKRSMDNGGQYVIVVPCFGLFLSESKNLNVFAPTDTPFSWYCLNGKVRTFTSCQKIADQNATPVLC